MTFHAQIAELEKEIAKLKLEIKTLQDRLANLELINGWDRR